MATKKQAKAADENPRYIRVRKDGFIYPYDETLAKNSLCEVVEGEMPEADEDEESDVAPPSRSYKGTRTSGLNLATDLPGPGEYRVPPEIEADASKKLPK